MAAVVVVVVVEPSAEANGTASTVESTAGVTVAGASSAAATWDDETPDNAETARSATAGAKTPRDRSRRCTGKITFEA